jgi:hypothetical protein
MASRLPPHVAGSMTPFGTTRQSAVYLSFPEADIRFAHVRRRVLMQAAEHSWTSSLLWGCNWSTLRATKSLGE